MAVVLIATVAAVLLFTLVDDLDPEGHEWAVVLGGILLILGFCIFMAPRLRNGRIVELTQGERLTLVALADVAVIVTAVAAGWSGRDSGSHVAWLGGMVGALAVITFFGMLWSYPSKIAGKRSIRASLAATIIIVYLSLAGLFVFDVDLIDEPRKDASPAEVKQVKADEKTQRDVFGDISTAFLTIMGFYFASAAAENISTDRVAKAAIEKGDQETARKIIESNA